MRAFRARRVSRDSARIQRPGSKGRGAKRVLRRASRDVGLDPARARLRFHDLRHTFASQLIIDIRLDVARVSRILGHARTSMTLDTYTHLYEQAAHGAEVQ